MLMEVKNQIKIVILSTKYAVEREMLNKVTFISNIIFMILNNAGFIIQWVILYSLKDNVGGYSFKQVLLLWGIAAGTFGISHFFFKASFELTDTINTGKLDTYLIQPKNVLLSCTTSSVEVSAIGDIIYAYIMLFLYGITPISFLLFTFFCIVGGLILSSISIIHSSLSFWFGKVDVLTSTITSMMTTFSTYPEGIFKGLIKILLYTIIPIGFVNYLPIQLVTKFNIVNFIIVILFAIVMISLAFIIFYKGLKRYSSSNLMNARI